MDGLPELPASAEPSHKSTAWALLETMRPHQWVKNLFVAAPLVFSKHLFEGPRLLRASIAVVLFSLLSGAVYIINDIVDVEQDRLHPRKAARPIARGVLSLPVARRAALLVTTLALGGAALLGPPFALVSTAYFLLNLAYSLRFKHVVFLDVLAISIGFLLRVLGGIYAVSVPGTIWLLVCTALLASLLGFGKRAHELQSSGDRAETQRRVLADYRLDHLRWVLRLLAVATILAYVAYTLSSHTALFFGTRSMIFTVPLIAIGIFRFLYLVDHRPAAESPTEEMLRDPLFLVNLFLWVAAVVVIVYFPR